MENKGGTSVLCTTPLCWAFLSMKRLSSRHFCWCCIYAHKEWRQSRARSCSNTKGSQWQFRHERVALLEVLPSSLNHPPNMWESSSLKETHFHNTSASQGRPLSPVHRKNTRHEKDHIICLIWPAVGHDPEPTSTAKIPRARWLK